MVAIVLAGLIGLRFLPISALPQVDFPTIQVQTLYPGASPEVISQTITAPLERQFGQMSGLKRMSSASAAGISTVTNLAAGILGASPSHGETRDVAAAAASSLANVLSSCCKLPMMSSSATGSSALPLGLSFDCASMLMPGSSCARGATRSSVSGPNPPATAIATSSTPH